MDVSIIVVSYNTRKLTHQTLNAVQKSCALTPKLTFELIVVDNGSSDGSDNMIQTYKPTASNCTCVPILLKENVGFGAGNNRGIQKSKGKYVLLLNSDVIADTVNFENLIAYMKDHQSVGGLTVRVELPDGSIDPASHRGFPTLWRSFCYFSKLQALTYPFKPLRKYFGGYHMLDKDLMSVHEIDAPTAAFHFIRGDVLRSLHGFDESYFMYGEDLDLSKRMFDAGYTTMYYPKYTVVHLKHQSGLKNKKHKTKSITTFHFYHSMKIFYDTHYAPSHHPLVNWLVHRTIDAKYYAATH